MGFIIAVQCSLTGVYFSKSCAQELSLPETLVLLNSILLLLPMPVSASLSLECYDRMMAII